MTISVKLLLHHVVRHYHQPNLTSAYAVDTGHNFDQPKTPPIQGVAGIRYDDF
jgi:hypothetical protein